MSQAALAKDIGTSQATIDKIERGVSRQSKFLPAVFKRLGLPLEDLSTVEPADPSPQADWSRPRPNATIGPSVELGATRERIPVYGQAIGGEDGRFILNGNKITDVLAPPSLVGVHDAYAVFVVGDSMEPRYEPGETVYVHPRLPVRKGDYVVVQIRAPDDGDPPQGYVKRFISLDRQRLRLRQFNPDKEIVFPAAAVVSIHKIVLGG